MEKGEIRQRVEKVVSQVLKADPKDLRPESNFAFDLGADSMSSVALIAAFEEEFDIEMEEDKAREVQTVGEAVDFIAQYVTKS
ncbi:MAG: acpP [Bacteroidetes bacterium]|nr:acpP [Bacteroidota bacterium]